MKNTRTLVIDLNCDTENINGQNLDELDSSKTDIAFQRKDFSNYTPFTKVSLIDFDELYSTAYDSAFKEVIDFGEYKLKPDISVAKAFCLSDGKSLWYYFRFMVLYKRRSQLFESSIVEKIVSLKSEYDRFVFIHKSGYLETLLNDYNNVDSIRLKSVNKKDKLTVLNFCLISIVRFFKGLFSLPLIFSSGGKYYFLSNAQAEQNVISKGNLELLKGDHFSEYFQSEIERNKNYINISEFFPPKLTSNSNLRYKKHYTTSRYNRTINLETILYLQLLNPLFYFRAIKEMDKLKLAFRWAQDKSEDSGVLSILKEYKRLCYFIAVRKSALYWLLKRSNIKAIISTNEHDSRVKSVMEVANGIGLKTFGIQHGVIHSRHLHYYFSEADSKFQPYPSFTFVWGNYWSKELQNFSSYKENSLVIVGQLRTDVIPDLKKQNRKDLICNLDSGRYTVMYPSQPLYVGEEKMREKLATDFLKLTIEFPELQFVVKPHPLEHDCEAFFNGIAKQLGTNNYTILNEDLYKLLSFCDLVVIYNSTVGAEAVYFRKPLIVMNYSQNDFSGFIKDKIALEVNDYIQLREGVLNAKSGGKLIEVDHQEDFIRERAYHIDGKVAQRIIEFVELNTST